MPPFNVLDDINKLKTASPMAALKPMTASLDIDPSLSFEGNANNFGEAKEAFQNQYQEAKSAYNKFDPNAMSMEQLGSQAILAFLPLVAGRLLGGNRGGVAGAEAGGVASQVYGQQVKAGAARKQQELLDAAQTAGLEYKQAGDLEKQFAIKGMDFNDKVALKGMGGGKDSKEISDESLAALEAYSKATDPTEKSLWKTKILKDANARDVFFEDRKYNQLEKGEERRTVDQKNKLKASNVSGLALRSGYVPSSKAAEQAREASASAVKQSVLIDAAVASFKRSKGVAASGQEAALQGQLASLLTSAARKTADTGASLTGQEPELLKALSTQSFDTNGIKSLLAKFTLNRDPVEAAASLKEVLLASYLIDLHSNSFLDPRFKELYPKIVINGKPLEFDPDDEMLGGQGFTDPEKEKQEFIRNYLSKGK